MNQLSLLFNEAEVYADKAAEADDDSVAVVAHKRRKKHEYTLDHLPEDVPVEVVEHRLRSEELAVLLYAEGRGAQRHRLHDSGDGKGQRPGSF